MILLKDLTISGLTLAKAYRSYFKLILYIRLTYENFKALFIFSATARA
jgi:hypothetical protein